MADFASVTDVEDRWRPLTPAETDLAQMLIADASDMVRVLWDDIDSRLANDGIRDVTVRRVVAGMVRRAMMNRQVEGVAQQTDTAGPFTQAQTYVNPSNNLFFTKDERAALSPNGYRPLTRQGWAG